MTLFCLPNKLLLGALVAVGVAFSSTASPRPTPTALSLSSYRSHQMGLPIARQEPSGQRSVRSWVSRSSLKIGEEVGAILAFRSPRAPLRRLYAGNDAQFTTRDEPLHVQKLSIQSLAAQAAAPKPYHVG